MSNQQMVKSIMSRALAKSLAVVALTAGLAGVGLAPAQGAPVDVRPVAESEPGSSVTGSAETLLAFPLGFILFGACFADGPGDVHNPLCQALLDLATASGSLG
ncbi:hypothetical protein ACIGO9_22295 [Nocardia asteroides]|uniref:hypothetical protein n=1 Tax=Nocardia asteroides TaxID=1824 RepID=UPI0037C97583